MSYFGDLEAGVALLLADLKTSKTVKKIAYFGGRIEDLEALRERLTAGAPTILVQAQGGTVEKVMAGGTYYRQSRIAVILIDRSARGRVIQRRGSGHAGEPVGIYELIEECHDRLVEQFPVDGTGTVIPGNPWRLIEEIDNSIDKDLQVWVLIYETRVAHDGWATVDRASLDDFERHDGEGDAKGPRGDYDALEKLHDDFP